MITTDTTPVSIEPDDTSLPEKTVRCTAAGHDHEIAVDNAFAPSHEAMIKYEDYFDDGPKVFAVCALIAEERSQKNAKMYPLGAATYKWKLEKHLVRLAALHDAYNHLVEGIARDGSKVDGAVARITGLIEGRYTYRIAGCLKEDIVHVMWKYGEDDTWFDRYEAALAELERMERYGAPQPLVSTPTSNAEKRAKREKRLADRRDEDRERSKRAGCHSKKRS